MTLYAAYGTNLHPGRMGERCPHSPLSTTGWLTGWRLTFGGEEHGWDGALSTIVEDPLEQVFVAVYDITREDEDIEMRHITHFSRLVVARRRATSPLPSYA